jgi:hypothetical protein
VQETAKRVLALRIDPETPESFMLRPKRRRWENPHTPAGLKRSNVHAAITRQTTHTTLLDMDKEGWEPKPMIYS